MPFAAFFSNNPIIAWGLVFLTALGIIKGKEEFDEARGARQQQRKMETRARKVQKRIESENDEKLEKADTARDGAPIGAVSSGELSDSTRSVLFGDS